MTKVFICDKCGDKFPQAIEEVSYKDEHAVWHVIDLCAPCMKKRNEKKDKVDKEFTK